MQRKGPEVETPQRPRRGGAANGVSRLPALLAVVCLSTGALFSDTLRLAWDHDGLGENGSPVEICHFEVYEADGPTLEVADGGRLVGRTPQGRPEETWFELEVPRDGRTRYFAVRAVDREGNRSDFSAPLGISSRRLRVQSP